MQPEDTSPPTICRCVAYQAAVDALMEATIKRHEAKESTLEYRAYEQAESACLEALCSIVDAYCAGRIAEMLMQIRTA